MRSSVAHEACYLCYVNRDRADVFFNLLFQITDFLATRAVPDLRRFLIDTDKAAAVCGNMVYYIVAPSLKTRSR